MENALSEVIEIIAGIMLAILGVVFISVAIKTYNKYDSYLVAKNANKSSSFYTMAYSDFEDDLSYAEVVNNIISSDCSIVEINSTIITEEMLTQARDGKESDINAIKRIVGTGNYKVRYQFNNDGTLNGLFFKGE